MKQAASFFILLFIMLFLPQPAAQAAERQRASLVVIFVDRATNSDGEKQWIVDRVQTFLQGKVNGIYDITPGKVFELRVKSLDLATGSDEKTLFAILGESGADYALLAELVSAKESGSMGLFRSSKNANIGLNLKILDLVNGGYLKQERFTGSAVDDNAVISIGDRLVAVLFLNSREITEKALEKLLFQAGEIISVNLPLGKPVKRLTGQ